MTIAIKQRQYVIGFDGTGNTADVENEVTNVFKLSKLFKPQEDPPFLYKQGVGTKVGETVSGNIWGAGISERLVEAYRWLTDQFNYSGRELDEYKIYVFGFSRGAYIARIFCWLVAKCGLPADVYQYSVLWGFFLSHVRGKIGLAELDDKIIHWRGSNQYFTPEIEMLGVWDTVKTADFGGDGLEFDNRLANNVKNAYHAMALDELRTLFPVLRFQPDPRVRELWFAGNHCDIGGGYPEDGLSNISLQWMLDRAIDHGLHFHNNPPKPDILQPCHDEASKPFWIAIGLKNCSTLDTIRTPRTVLSHDLVSKQVEVKQQSLEYSPKARIPADVDFVEC